MRKVVIKISQGNVVTQTVLGGITIHLPPANFLCFISAKLYENWLRVDKVITMNTVCSFLAHPVCTVITLKIWGAWARFFFGGGLCPLPLPRTASVLRRSTVAAIGERHTCTQKLQTTSTTHRHRSLLFLEAPFGLYTTDL